ncbi:MAG: RagB/SusD family nutrient uptake outer membrane protein [Prevotella sp.]|nr:RagB/SusD family nutrient uptake outer membrane protein [Prevotella sp.]
MRLRPVITRYLASLLLVTASSCSINIPPPDLYSDPDAITTVQSARSLLTSCYLLYPHYEYELSMLGNDFCPTSLSGKNVDLQNLYNWQDKDISKLATDVWLAYYNTIASCDVLTERLPNVVAADGTDDAAEVAAITAEVKTLKALCYLQLLRLYAPAYDEGAEADGIVIKSQVGLEFPARSSVAVCTDFIRSLLTEAAATANAPSQNGWLSQHAAVYLLAELELYAGNWTAALAYAQQLLEAAPATALTAQGYARLWEPASFEGRLFAFNTATTYYAGIEFDAAEGDYFALNPALLLSDGDARKPLNEYPMEMAGATRSLLGKYNRCNKLGQTIAYIDQLRYAGALFIAAETLARTGQEAEARQLVNDYLSAMGATPIDAHVSGTALTEAILQEKAKEFAGEGTNWFDLKRTHTALPRLNRWGVATASTVKPDDYRWSWPIPSAEYKYNEAVTQNDGWPINR